MEQFDSKKVHPETLVEILIFCENQVNIESTDLESAVYLTTFFEEISFGKPNFKFLVSDRN